MVREPARRMAVYHQVIDPLDETFLQPVPERGDVAHPAGDLRGSDLRGLAQAHESGNILRSGASAVFLDAAFDLGLDPHVFANIERRRSLWPVELVARERERVHTEGLHVHRDPSRGGDRVGMEQHTLFAGNGADLLDRLYRADLIVRVHDGDKDRVLVDGPGRVSRINKPLLVHRQIRNGETGFFERLRGMKNGKMLYLRYDDVPALLAVRLRKPLQREVIRLRAARRKKYLFRSGPDERRGLCPCFLYRS